ncbi:MAG: alkane 1-monooxygenase [Cyanobacteria bacterium P01_D01_bin.56]
MVYAQSLRISQPLRIYLTSLGFLTIYALPIIPILSGWLAQNTPYPNILACLPLVIAYGLPLLVSAIAPEGIKPIPKETAQTPGWQLYYRGLLWLSLPVQLGMLFITWQYWHAVSFNIWGSVAYVLSVGIYSGAFAITIGHELIHHTQRCDRLLGGLLLSTVGFGSFKVVHLKIHHRYVGTPLDFATAQRGQTIYGFWWQNLMGNVTEAIRCDRAELTRTRRAFWQSELLLWTAFSGLWLGLSIELGQWQGGLFWSLQALIGILKLDWTNYLQHYGLTRQQTADGKYEPVNATHAWSLECFLLDFALINLMRHGDHHAHPQQLYPTLKNHKAAPQYPYNYAAMYLLSLVPSVFRRVVHPHLEHIKQGDNNHVT